MSDHAAKILFITLGCCCGACGDVGKAAALTAGLDFCNGDVVVPIDVDLQDPPELIPKFLEQWREGFDVVHGVRDSRASDGFIKRKTAALFYNIFNRMSEIQIPSNSGDYRLMDRRVVEEIKKLRERNRFMKGLMAWPGPVSGRRRSPLSVPKGPRAKPHGITGSSSISPSTASPAFQQCP